MNNNILQDKLKNFLGSAEVNLKHLHFDSSLELLDENNVERLVGMFKAGCFHADEGNRIPAKIEKHDLNAAVARSGKVASDLFRIGDFPRLSFPETFNLACLHGRDFTKAAKQAFPLPGDQWWTVDFYTTGTLTGIESKNH
jgi:hypothetical protein